MRIPKLLVPLEEQALRFVRLFGLALLTQGVALGHWDRSAIVAVVVAAAETAWKELHAQVKQARLSKNAVVQLADDHSVGTDLGEVNPPDPNV